MEKTLLLTVAMCTHNHADRLVRTFAALAELKMPPCGWEMLVIDNASKDDTPTFLSNVDWCHANVSLRIEREMKLGLSNARNRALDEARGEYILFMDDDETPDPNWLIEYAAAIEAHRPDALGGRIEVFFEDGVRPPWLQDELLGFLGKLDHGLARQLREPQTPIFGGNFGFRRDVFAKIGRFDVRLGRMGAANIGGEDTEIYRRLLAAGCRVWWVPNAIIHHRIQTPKLNRRYFLDLHFRQGRTEGGRKRGAESKIPPRYLWPQLFRALWRALNKRLREGANRSLRLEMNAAYFVGYIIGWNRES